MKNIIILFLLGAVFILSGCGSNDGNVRYLSITPQNASLHPSDTMVFSTTAFTSSDRRVVRPTWNVTNQIGTISANGAFIAGSLGTLASKEGQLIASYENQTIAATIRVINNEVVLPTSPATPEEPAVDPSLSTPQNISSSNLSIHSLSITWNTVNNAQSYLVSFGTDSQGENLGTRSSTANTLVITGLTISTSYYVKVKAMNSNEESSYSDIISFQTSDYPQKFTVNGNRIMDESTQEVIFRGICIKDPVVLNAENHLNSEYFDALATWNPKLVRIPIHPASFKDPNFFVLLDRTLGYLESHKIYAILDFHSIGFPPNETYEPVTGLSDTDNYYRYTLNDLRAFWTQISERYSNDNRIAFYELFNEPTAGSGSLAQSWEQWRLVAEGLIDTIRANDPDSLIIVGGLDYSYDLSYANSNPINKTSIVYGTHPYPNKALSYDLAFGNLKSRYPVMATEFGFDPNAPIGNPYRGETTYGNNIISYLEGKKISWQVWNFSPDWGPALISDWTFAPTVSGSLFKNYIH